MSEYTIKGVPLELVERAEARRGKEHLCPQCDGELVTPQGSPPGVSQCKKCLKLWGSWVHPQLKSRPSFVLKQE